MDQRIEALEKDLAALRNDFATVLRICMRQGGEIQAYRHALLAVIATLPKSERLETALRDAMARVEAHVVGESESEEHLEAVQEAQGLVILALKESSKRDA